MKVYLCGPINGRSDDDARGWREYAKTMLPDTLDPMVRDYRGRELEPGIADVIVAGDEEDIANCDVLLVYYDKPSVGTSMEIRMAVKEMGKRVVLVDKSPFVKKVRWSWNWPFRHVSYKQTPLSPWLLHHCPIIVKSLDEGIAACK